MDVNQSEEEKTEKNTKTVSIVLNEESIKEQNLKYENNLEAPHYDHIITINKIPLLGIKYFKFGKTIHFYCCCSLKNTKYKLSEVPTSLFTLGPECK